VGVQVPRSDELSPRFRAIVNPRLPAVPVSKVPGVDPEALDRPAMAGVTVERFAPRSCDLGNLVEDPGQLGQGFAHRSSVSTCAAGASSVMTLSQAPMVLETASA